ncbi:MAG TPA: hypothetical protein VIC54_06215 [Terriglobales bacterium]|jgi:hypothetical protein
MAFRPSAWLGAAAVAAGLALTAAAAAPPPTLYLLAATPSSSTNATYPAALYREAAGGTMTLVRPVFTAQQGVYDVRDDLDGRLYVIDDKLDRVSIIHEAHPAQADLVTPPAAFSFYWPSYGEVAGANPGLLLASTQDGQRVITRVLGDASATQPRIATAGAAYFPLYQAFRYQGAFGGPNTPVTPQAMIVGRQIALLNLDQPEVVLGQTPASFKPPFVLPGASLNVNLVAVTARYLAFSVADPDGGAGPTTVYVRDQRLGTWKTLTVPVPEIEPDSRLFGAWLATPVKQWVQGQANPPESPGMENQRDTGPHLGGAQALPNVREAYYLLQQSFTMPGDLELDNLADGRKLTLHTGQQDSEVLDVTAAGEVLYRVNDVIYSAHIAGVHIAGIAKLVQGENVPEVHWVFYAPARP